MPTRFRLAALLADRDLSQRRLAKLSGVSGVTINGMCTNRTRRVDLATLDAIARVLKVEPGELIERHRGTGMRS